MSRTVLSFTPEEEKLAEALLDPSYQRLLYRAVAARLATTSAHFEEHRTILDLMQDAYPGIHS